MSAMILGIGDTVVDKEKGPPTLVRGDRLYVNNQITSLDGG